MTVRVTFGVLELFERRERGSWSIFVSFERLLILDYRRFAMKYVVVSLKKLCSHNCGCTTGLCHIQHSEALIEFNEIWHGYADVCMHCCGAAWWQVANLVPRKPNQSSLARFDRMMQ